MIAQVDPGEAVNGYRYAFAPCQGDAERKKEILEGAGHLPEVEAPDKVNALPARVRCGVVTPLRRACACSRTAARPRA